MEIAETDLEKSKIRAEASQYSNMISKNDEIFGNVIYYEWRGAIETDNIEFEKCTEENN